MNKLYQITSKIAEKKIFFISDLHYSTPKDLKKYQFILLKLKKEKPDFVCIGGDLLDSSRVEQEEKIIQWITALAIDIPVLIVLGNHDITSGIKEFHYDNNIPFWDKIKQIPNVFLLDNMVYETNDIRFIGLSIPYPYYFDFEQKEKRTFIKDYTNQVYPNPFPKDKMNILLVHCSNDFLDQDMPLLNTISLILSGHNHNGMVPVCLEGIMKHRGIISPGRTFFPRHIRGKFSNAGRLFIISGGITKLSKRSKLSVFDCFWNHEITKIEIKKRP